ncbi:hypothetical protein [Thermomonospora cellulosilytica]|uniref:Asp23/Gls24 family envelope stress response protein n=1 Tax=Thermomonospora cellulosilytica TaxID=1411118 RepID=A0A7W3N505_9ACTN|nr:hypothetical protein [Thermomonospora cellulosilytica]MBA9007632.1 hypothetical protein [Thermomonospora cellulosilytica]
MTAPAPPAPSTAELAGRIAERARAVAGVVRLTAGPRAEVVTYRPGPPLPGVAVRADEVRVSVVVLPDRPVTETAEAVRAAVAPLAGERAVHVIVADLADPAETTAGDAAR